MKPFFLVNVALILTASTFTSAYAHANSAADVNIKKEESWPVKPVLIAHRGASALRPEHTIAAYQLAIESGADIIEPDLVLTKDGVLIARHENNISETTDVAEHPEFASRKVTKIIDGVSITGWFSEDFTLSEIKTLRAKERIPVNRPNNTSYNGQLEIPTLQEVIDLVQTESRTLGRVIGIYPETKHPSYFRSIGLPMEQRLVQQLESSGYKDKLSPVFIQSFEVSNLKLLRSLTSIQLVQLIDNPKNRPTANGTPRNKPYDFVVANDVRTYADMITPDGLKEIATYANVVAPYKDTIIPRDSKNNLGSVTSLVADAHAANLKIHTWTFRPENPFLPTTLRNTNPTSPSERGDSATEITLFLKAGIDGFFTDDPKIGRSAIDDFNKKN